MSPTPVARRLPTPESPWLDVLQGRIGPQDDLGAALYLCANRLTIEDRRWLPWIAATAYEIFKPWSDRPHGLKQPLNRVPHVQKAEIVTAQEKLDIYKPLLWSRSEAENRNAGAALTIVCTALFLVDNEALLDAEAAAWYRHLPSKIAELCNTPRRLRTDDPPAVRGNGQ